MSKKTKKGIEYLGESFPEEEHKVDKIPDIIYWVNLFYNCELLNELDLEDDSQFFKKMQKSLKELFLAGTYEYDKELCNALLSMIQNSYCDDCLSRAKQLFIAAIIHVCFEKVRDREDCFEPLFSSELFNSDNGKTQAFCRFVIVSEIENYIRFYYGAYASEEKPWLLRVIDFDGGAFDKITLTATSALSLLKCLWSECDESRFLNKTEHANKYIPYNEIGDTSSCVYWYRRIIVGKRES